MKGRKKRIKQMKGRQLGQVHTFARNAVRDMVSQKAIVASLVSNYNLTKTDAKKLLASAKHYVKKEKEAQTKESK